MILTSEEDKDYLDRLKAAAAERDALRARVAELEKDKARLDWAIKNPATFYRNWIFSTYMPPFNQVEARQAIDAAMKESTHD